MDEAIAALPLEFENYEKRVETLAILHQYIEGTYTLFPERQKKHLLRVEINNYPCLILCRQSHLIQKIERTNPIAAG